MLISLQPQVNFSFAFYVSDKLLYSPALNLVTALVKVTCSKFGYWQIFCFQQCVQSLSYAEADRIVKLVVSMDLYGFLHRLETGQIKQVNFFWRFTAYCRIYCIKLEKQPFVLKTELQSRSKLAPEQNHQPCANQPEGFPTWKIFRLYDSHFQVFLSLTLKLDARRNLVWSISYIFSSPEQYAHGELL